MKRAALFGAVVGLLCGISVVFGALVVIPVAVWFEQTYIPPQVNWRVTDWKIEGDDVVLSGYVTKVRNCTYKPPPRARDAIGQNFLIDSSSPTRHLTWSASPFPQKFGPWRVIGGARKTLYFYQEFSCHILWTTTVELGVLDAREESK